MDEQMSKCSPNIGGYSPNMPTGSCGTERALMAVKTPRIHPPLEPLPMPPVNQPRMNNVMPGFVPRPSFPPSQLIGAPLVCHSPPVFSPPMPVPMMQIPGFPFMCPPAIELPLGLDPFLAQKASVWSSHVSLDGNNYYYNAMTQISTWDKPEVLIEFEKTLNANAAATLIPAESLPKPVPKPVPEPEPVIQRSQEKKPKPYKKEKQDTSTTKEKRPKPIASKFIPGSVWCLVKTSDNRIFFYNACKKSSEWEIPPELTHNPEIYQMMEEMRKESIQPTDNGKTIETMSQNSAAVPTTSANKCTESSTLDTIEGEIVNSSGKNQTEDKLKSLRRKHLKDENGMTKKDSDSPITIKNVCLEDDIQECKECLTTTSKGDDPLNVEPNVEFLSLEDIKSLKGIDIEIVERLAAKERATTTFELRSQKFQELLQDKNISAFSTWQRELPKIIYDPRYLLLTFKERKSAFEAYVKARANDEAKENQTRLKNARQEFCKFVEGLLDDDEDLSYDRFERKFAKDSRLSLIDKAIDRKRLFMKLSAQYQQKAKRELEKRNDDIKSKKKLARKEAKKGFKTFLDKKITSYHYHWKNVWKDFDLWTDRRFLQLDESEMKEIFQKHCQKLKRKSKESKDEKHSKKRKKEKNNDGKGHSEVPSSSPSPQRTGHSSDKNMSEGEISTDSA